VNAWLAGAIAIGGACAAFFAAWLWSRIAYPREFACTDCGAATFATFDLRCAPCATRRVEDARWWDEFSHTWGRVGWHHCMRSLGITPIRRSA
jgi:hypothetical protein